MINVRHLAIFRTVMQAGSVSAAARVLNVSQPAVTKMLQQVEEDVGATLFSRTKGRLHPTPDGIRLIDPVDRVFDAVQEVEHLADEISKGVIGRVSIATTSALGSSIIASAVGKYARLRPKASIEVLASTTRQVIEEVANDRVDIGIVDAGSIEGMLASEPLCRARYGVVCARTHRLVGRESIALADIEGEKIITFTEETFTGMEVRRRLRAIDPNAGVDISTNQSLINCMLVSSGLGIGIIDPFLVLSGMFDNLTICTLEPHIEFITCLVFPPNRPPSIASSEFTDLVRKTFEEFLSRSALLQRL